MQRLTYPGVSHLPYFTLCRELGAAAVDEMARGRILELRWSPTVTPESDNTQNEESQNSHVNSSSEGVHRDDEVRQHTVGPVVLPTTPILAYAMRVVLNEWGYGRGRGSMWRRVEWRIDLEVVFWSFRRVCI